MNQSELTEQKKQSKELTLIAAQIAQERNSSNIVAMDLLDKSPATDFLVIATGTSNRQLRTVADEVTAKAKKMGFPLFGQAGYDEARWILLDFVTVVVHLFDEEYREFYDLEMLWGDGERLELEGPQE